MRLLICLALLVPTALVGGAVPASAGPDRHTPAVSHTVADQRGAPDARVVSTTPDEIWPDPADRQAASSATLTYTVERAARYRIQVVRGRGIWAEQRLGAVEASQAERTWTWDGRVFGGQLAERGSYRFEIVRVFSSGRYETAARSGTFEVHNSTGTIDTRDRRREARTGRADLTWFTIANGPEKVRLEWDFRRAVARRLGQVQAGLDVDRARRGYVVGVERRAGRLKVRIQLALLGTNVGGAQEVSCPRARPVLRAHRVTLTIPRRCLEVGGTKVRAFYSAWLRNPRYSDYGPDNGDYWTKWATYEPRP
ncbi:MAG: hypothetical protein WBP61_13855 [Nocardioides sp.]